MADRDYAGDINRRANSLLKEYTELADEIYKDVAARFN